MKALRDLRRFILIKCAEGNEEDVRAYVIQNIDTIAYSFGIRAAKIMDAVQSTPGDRVLAERLLETIVRAEMILRKGRKERRAKAAQESADILTDSVRWSGDKAIIDMPSLLSSALTRRQDMLVFTGANFTVSIPMAYLLDLARIARVRADLTGYVDTDGMHLRWRSGGLNLRSHENGKAEKIIVRLPPRVPAVAA
jgi:hypothetical protein